MVKHQKFSENPPLYYTTESVREDDKNTEKIFYFYTNEKIPHFAELLLHFDNNGKGKLYIKECNIAENTANLKYQLKIFDHFTKIALIFQVNEFRVKRFPIKKQEINGYLKFFQKSFQNHVKFIKRDIHDGYINDLIISIKNIRVTHYVPQFYLRYFSTNLTDAKSEQRIFCYDKKEKKLLKRGNSEKEETLGLKIKTISFRNYFYSIIIENYLSNIVENKIKIIFDKIIDSKSLDSIDQQEKIAIVRYIMIQILRTEENRNYIKEFWEKNTLSIAKEFLKSKKYEQKEIDGIQVEYNDRFIRMHQEELILNFIERRDIIENIINRKWGLITTYSSNFFSISDNPVILINQHADKMGDLEERLIRKNIKSKYGKGNVSRSTRQDGRGRGFLSEGLEIYLPLTPNICLYIRDQKKGIRLLKIKSINRELIIQSNRYIFSNSKDFEWAMSFLTDHPEYSDKKGERVKIEWL
jgi:hypothetical protein